MTPDQLLADARKGKPAPVYFFFGPEIYQRDACCQALLDAVMPAEEREAGLTRLDLEDATLAQVLDDARSMSLFAPRRLIWVSRAEAALPRGRAAAAGDEEASSPKSAAGEAHLAAYVKDPTPGVVVVFDSSRHEWDGDDKAKAERVRKFFSVIAKVVEFPRWTPVQARRLAQDLASAARLRMAPAETVLLSEAVGNSPARVAVEIEKLRLFAGDERAVTAEDLAALVPSAQAARIFELTGALGRNDRAKALHQIDGLVREGEYLPLALQFLAAQFRQALVAHEAGLKNGYQVQGHFAKMGAPMWPARAAQILETLEAYGAPRIRDALVRIARADRELRDNRPDDRVVLEQFVLDLTRPA